MEKGTQFGIYSILLALFCGINLPSVVGQTDEDEVDSFLPGFVITESRDTIYGDIFYEEWEAGTGLLIEVRNAAGETEDYSYTAALFNRANEIFVRNPFDGDRQFLQVLLDGEVKLLGYSRPEFYVDKKLEEPMPPTHTVFFGDRKAYMKYYIEKNGTTYALSKSTYQDKLVEYFGEEMEKLGQVYSYYELPMLFAYHNRKLETDNKYFKYKTVLDENGNIYQRQYKVTVDLNDKIKSSDELYKLVNGALVVRLKTNRRKIDAYLAAGYEDKAKELELELKAVNRSIMSHFLAYFNFTDVYFIYVEDYAKLLNQEFSGYFLNEKMEYDPSIKMSNPNFFFCDRGPAYAVAMKNSNDPNTKVASDVPRTQDAFVIKDQELNQLVDPFPFSSIIRLNDIEGGVKRLNKGLIQFYGN